MWGVNSLLWDTVYEEFRCKSSMYRLKLSLISIFSGSYVYIQLFHFNGNETNLFIVAILTLTQSSNAHLKLSFKNTII